MSECVVRMEMPEGCGYCRIAQFGYCGITHEPVADAYMGYPENRPKTCPILAVLPENHGRLVDADACSSVLRKLENEAKTNTEKLCYGYTAKMFEEAYTIVPAERSETCLD